MNPENKKQVIVISVLGIIFVGVLLKQFVFAGGGDTTTSTSTNESNRAAATGAAPGEPTTLNIVEFNVDELLAGVKEVTFNYDLRRVERRPMWPLAGQLLGDTGIQVIPVMVMKDVTGIVWDPNRPMAVVDGEVVGLGYTYEDGIQVHSIERDKVWFKIGEALIPVEMKKEL